MTYKEASKVIKDALDAVESAHAALETSRAAGQAELKALAADVDKQLREREGLGQSIQAMRADLAKHQPIVNELRAQVDALRVARAEEEAKLDAARTSLSVLKANVSNI